MSELVLRPYQSASLEALREGLRAGHRNQILCAPTGSGKSVCAVSLIAEAIKKLSKVWFVVDRIVLCNQISAMLDDYGIAHGVMQSGHWRRRAYEPVQVCSAQTLEKRGISTGIDLMIVDEVHCQRKQITEFIGKNHCPVVGLSATPFTKGLGKTYTNLVNVVTTDELTKEGFLVPLKMYAAIAPNMKGAKVIAGEWADHEVETRGKEIIGDIVREWANKTALHFGGPVKTLVFSATVDHGAELCRQFNVAGFNFQQLSYKDGSDEARKIIIDEFRKPDSAITGLVSCEVLTKGFDVPDILCLVCARPYRKSLSSHIQQLGRAMRTSPGKTFALVLDHAGNAIRFKADTDEFFANGIHRLDDGAHEFVRKEPEKSEAEEIKCSCGYILPMGATMCPACGKERRKRSLVETLPGEMVLINGVSVALPEFLHDRESVWTQICGFALVRKRGETEAARKWALAQYRNLYGGWPRNEFVFDAPALIDHRVKARIQSNLIRYWKGKGGQSRAVQ